MAVAAMLVRKALFQNKGRLFSQRCQRGHILPSATRWTDSYFFPSSPSSRLLCLSTKTNTSLNNPRLFFQTTNTAASRLRIQRQPFSSSALSQASPTPSEVTNKNNSTGATTGGLLQLLNEQERNYLQQQRQITEQSRNIAQQVGLSLQHLDGSSSSGSSILHDYSTYNVVLCGEYNAGKSTLINALLGTKLMETGSLPTTDCITIVSSASAAALPEAEDERDKDPTEESSASSSASSSSSSYHHPGVIHHYVSTADLPLLQDLTLVDTPGTNAVWTDHTTRTTRLLPAADLILFCTSCDRPFSESERSLLQSIAAYRKSIVLIVNKMDILEQTGGNHGAAEKQRVVDFVTDHASALLGARPIVLAVSARDALAAKTVGVVGSHSTSSTTTTTSALWQRSNFAALEHFLQTSLTTQHKLQAKLITPLGIAEGLLEQSLQQLQADRQALQADVATLNLLSSQFAAWRTELSTEMDRIRDTLIQRVTAEGQRGTLLVQRHASIWDFVQLTLQGGHNKNLALAKEWAKTLPATMMMATTTTATTTTTASGTTVSSSGSSSTSSIQADLLHQAQEAAESVATLGRAQGQAVIEFLGQRPSSSSSSSLSSQTAMSTTSLVGTVTAASRFEETRSHLLQHLTRAIEKHVEDEETVQRQQQALLTSLRRTALLSASLQVGGVGTAALLTALEWVDLIPGALLGSAVSACSAGMLLLGRQRATQAYASTWQRCAADLEEDLRLIMAHQVQCVDRRVQEGVAPYTRFVEAQQQRLDQLQNQAQETVAAANGLRHRIIHNNNNNNSNYQQ